MRSSRPMPRATSTHVGAGLLADVGDLVDERDLRRQERVGGELDHLRARDVGAHERRVRAARRARRPRRPPSRRSSPTTTRSGCMKSCDRRALLEELRAGDVGESRPCPARRTPAGSRRRCRTAPSTSSRARGRSDGGDRVHDRVHGGEVGVARVRRRGPDRDEQQARVLERVARARSRSAAARRCAPAAPRARARRSATSPRRSRSILSASMSTHQTSLPSSAKPAAVTRPT